MYNSGKHQSSLLGRDKREAIATIGSFDGVHRGHQSLLGQVRHIADERGLRAMAVTFGCSPKRVLGMTDAPQLNTIEERTALLRQSGMDEVAVLDFTPEMATMTARDFMQQVLHEQLGVAVLVIGYDHRFGRGRAEGFDDYVRYGQEMGIEVVRGEACMEGGCPISSSRIRQLLAEGHVTEANRLLGHSYRLQGQVVGGYQEGRKMGFPTANIQPSDASKLLPADGVYAVRVNVEQQTDLSDGDNFQFRHRGMLNIGYRPTLNNGRERSIEVHILDFEGDLYGKDIMVEFVHRLREERTYANTEELTEQLIRDEKMVRELLDIKE